MRPPDTGGARPATPVTTTPVSGDSFDLASRSRFQLARGSTLSPADLDTLKRAGKPVLAIVPPALAGNTAPAMRYQVHVHYQGMGSTAASPSGDSPLKERIAASFSQTPPTVFVLPHSATLDKATPQWGNVKNTGTTATDALAGLTGTRGELIVSAHSLGRRALESAIRSGGLVADRLDVQDAFYRTQPEGPRAVAQWMAQNPAAKVRVLITSSGMSDAATIRRQASFPPGTIVVDSPMRGHFDAGSGAGPKSASSAAARGSAPPKNH